jgi:hypothetical protein
MLNLPFMTSRLLIPALAFLLYSTAFAVADADTPLELAMKKMSSAYKELLFDLKQPHDAAKSHYLELAAALKAGAETSRGLVPQKAETLPTDQRVAIIKPYQKSMDDLIGWINSLTVDLQNSRWDDASKVMATLKQQMIYGHKDFRLKN